MSTVEFNNLIKDYLVNSAKECPADSIKECPADSAKECPADSAKYFFASKKCTPKYSAGTEYIASMGDIASIVVIMLLLFLIWFIWRCLSKPVYWFYRDSCPHCINMKTEWNKFESQCWCSMIQPIKINIADPANQSIADRYNIQSVPTIIKIESGVAFEYKGNRTYNDIYKWACN